MGEKPTAAFVVSLIGGIFVLLVGLAIAAIGSVIEAIGGGGLFTGLGLVGAIWGLLMIVGAVMLFSKPEQHQAWGALIVISSVLSIFGALGGFGVGLILGLIGGILGITWKPTAVMTVQPPQAQPPTM